MESHWSIILSGGRPSKAARLSPSGEVLEEFSPVWTLAELRARSGKSRRQIYRDWWRYFQIRHRHPRPCLRRRL